jgi:hypothetical protein
MNNKDYFIAGLKAFSAQLFFGLVYIIGEPYIKFQFWVELAPLMKFFIFIFIVFVPTAPFTKDFRNELKRRKELKV